MPAYDPEAVRRFYNEYGGREWARFERPLGRVQLHVILKFLERWVPAGGRVLDAGSGPGRFAVWLAVRGCRLTLVDVSDAMLEEARQRLAGVPVEGFHRASYVEMPFLADGGFDAALCLGGSLNYMPDAAARALAELARVVRPGGLVAGSVMSTLGALHRSLHTGWSPADDGMDADDIRQVLRTGTLAPRGRPVTPHAADMMTLAQTEVLLHGAGLEPVAFSATDCLLALPDARLAALQADPAAWAALLEAEVEACTRNPETGGHLLFAARRPG